jgi:cytochrome c
MDSFELNKIMGAVLFTLLVLVTLNITAGAVFTPHKPEKPGYEIAVQEHATDTAKGGAPAAEEPIEKLLASATVDKGGVAAKKCQACHTFEKDGPNRVGPNLWGVVGRARATEAKFNYSTAMKAKGGTWTIDELDHFLANPKGYIPGTNMAFAGLPRGSERADVIVYLNSLADNPKALPRAAEAPK